MPRNQKDNLTVPGPPGLPLVGNLFQMRRAADIRLFINLFQEFGDVVHLQIGPRHLYLINHPDDVQYVLQSNNRNYVKGSTYAKLKPVLGEGLFTSEGDFWRRQRRLAQPAFHRQKIAGFAGAMVAETDKMLEAWEERKPDEAFDVSVEMMRLTLSIVAKTLFSTALSEQDLDEVHESLSFILKETQKRIRRPYSLAEKLPTATNRAYDEHRQILDHIIYRIISQRRQSGEDLPDLLGMFMAAQDEETGQSMDDKQLRDEVMTIFLAGHETTAVGLSWAWMLLSEHPTVRQQLETEVDTVLGRRPPGAADYELLPYTLAVIEEAMRLYPPVPAIARQALADDELGGYPIPAGGDVIISPYTLHRRPDCWDNPEGFDPARFTSDRRSGRHRFAYIPFSGGPRFCIGNNFALLEAVLVLAQVTQRYRLNLVPGQYIQPQLTLTLRPKGGIRFTLQERE